MKKEDLRQAFAKIKPSEALINDTIMAVQTGQKVNRRNEKPAFSFTYRLAGAVCAFAVLLGVGVTFGKDIVLSPTEDTPAAYERTAFNDVDVFRPATVPSGLEADAIIPPVVDTPSDDELADKKDEAIAFLKEKANSLEGEWSLIYGAVDGCYFVSGGCFAIISAEEICAGETIDGGEEGLLVKLEFENDGDAEALTDAIGGSVCILVTSETADGETAYKASEIKILK